MLTASADVYCICWCWLHLLMLIVVCLLLLTVYLLILTVHLLILTASTDVDCCMTAGDVHLLMLTVHLLMSYQLMVCHHRPSSLPPTLIILPPHLNYHRFNSIVQNLILLSNIHFPHRPHTYKTFSTSLVVCATHPSSVSCSRCKWSRGIYLFMVYLHGCSLVSFLSFFSLFFPRFLFMQTEANDLTADWNNKANKEEASKK